MIFNRRDVGCFRNEFGLTKPVMVQWLRRGASKARGTGLTLVRELFPTCHTVWPSTDRPRVWVVCLSGSTKWLSVILGQKAQDTSFGV